MLILPAIDLREGACVRLMQGRFDAVTDYGDPLLQVCAFADAGAAWVHVVDLDGARLGRSVQRDLIGRVARETDLKVQSGGGVRARADVEALLDVGVERVVVGSVAVRAPAEVRDWIAAFGADRICVALDVRAAEGHWRVAADGWAADGGKVLEDVLDAFADSGLRHALVTDIARDGALSGPNIALMTSFRTLCPDIALQASGGVSALSDLAALKAAGASAAIVGRALYEKRFTLEDALAV
jgi:phosphoribosylformimino-5-aminoimidazole carboxamide ribotide isomerase